MRQEIFGPVAPITTFASEDEAIARANDTEYGLASYVYTRDLARTIRVAERLQFGMVGINSGLISNAGRAVRRGEGERVRARGQLRGDRGVPRHDVRRPARRLIRAWRSTADTADGLPRLRARGLRLAVLPRLGVFGRRATPRCSRGCRPCRSRSARPTWSSPRPGGTAYPRPVRTPACAPRCSVTGTDGPIRGDDPGAGDPDQRGRAGWRRCTRRSPSLAPNGPGRPLALLEVGRQRRAVPVPRPLLLPLDGFPTARPGDRRGGPLLECAVHRRAAAAAGIGAGRRGGPASTSHRSTSPTTTRCAGWRRMVWPEQEERRERLRAAVADRPRATRRTSCRATCSRPCRACWSEAPADATLVVFHSAVIAYLEHADRERFAAMMAGLVAEGRCHWVSNEGPRVLPGLVPHGRRRTVRALRARRRRPPGRPHPRPRRRARLALSGTESWVSLPCSADC